MKTHFRRRRRHTYLDLHISTTFPTTHNPNLIQDMRIPISLNLHHAVHLIQQ